MFFKKSLILFQCARCHGRFLCYLKSHSFLDQRGICPLIVSIRFYPCTDKNKVNVLDGIVSAAGRNADFGNILGTPLSFGDGLEVHSNNT